MYDNCINDEIYKITNVYTITIWNWFICIPLICIYIYVYINIYMYNGMHIIYLVNTNIMFIVQNTNVYKNLYPVFSTVLKA